MYNIGYPVNRNAPLNRGLTSWWVRPPVLVSNARLLDIAGINDGTFYLTPVYGTGGSRPGGWGGLTFDGTNHVDVTFVAKPAAFTVAAWIKNNGASATFQCVFAWGHSAAGIAVFRKTDVNQLQYGEYDGVNFHSATSTQTISGGWTHVAMTDDGTTVSLYINGAADGSGSVTTTPTLSVMALGAGRVVGSAHESGWIGQIDDWRFYNRTLSADEIAQLYRASKTGYARELNWIEDDEEELDYRAAGGDPPSGFVSAGRRIMRPIYSAVQLSRIN